MLSSVEVWHIIENNFQRQVSMTKNEKIMKRTVLAIFVVYIIFLLRLAVFRDDFLEYGLFEHGTLLTSS